MRNILKIAWRSIWRTRRRTLITTGAVAFGLALLLFSAGLMYGMMNEAQNDLANTGMGHIEIYAADYRVKKDVRRFIADAEAVAAKLEAAAPAGSNVGWRVVVQGLASSAWGSRGVRIHGVDPATEANLSKFFTDIRQGEPLRPGDLRGIIVGEGLAKRLKLRVNSKVRVMAQRVDNEVGADLFRVRGIFHALSPAANDSQAFVVAEAARNLIGIEGGAHLVLAQLPQAALSGPLATEIEAELGTGFEVLSFAELFPALEKFQKYIDQILFVSIFGIYFLVGLGILNTMLMSVLERTRELGVMMAVGTRRWRVVALIFGEAFWIATIGVIIGLTAGGTITWAVAELELLDWSEAVGEGMDMAGTAVSMVMRPALDAAHALQATLIVWFLTLLVGAYPAWRVSKLLPADALRAK